MPTFTKEDVIPYIKSHLESMIRDSSHRFGKREIEEIIEGYFDNESQSGSWYGGQPEGWNISYWANKKIFRVELYTKVDAPDDPLGWDYKEREYFNFSKKAMQKWYNISPIS